MQAVNLLAVIPDSWQTADIKKLQQEVTDLVAKKVNAKRNGNKQFAVFSFSEHSIEPSK